MLPASETPPSAVSVPPQIPFVEPGACTHGRPGQQSADVEQVLPFEMHELGAPHLLPTHGLPQQSALVAQTVPAAGAAPAQSTGLIRQRGIPSASLLQQFSGLLLQKLLGRLECSQQLFSALQESPSPGLQMLPGSRQAPPLSHRPNSLVALAFEHVTGPLTGSGAPDHPQQSLSARHTSPVGRQPDGG